MPGTVGGFSQGASVGQRANDPYLSTTTAIRAGGRQAKPKPVKPAPLPPMNLGGAGGAQGIPSPPSVLTPAPVAPPSGVPSMQGLQAAAAPMDALNGPTSGPLRQDLGNRQPPSLAALLQGLRY
jgi:hypothetical protein